MENIAVKIIYKGKIVIIGKGIRTEQSIVNELQKRFNIPEQQIALFSLQYEDNSKTINEAYSKAYQQGKQSIRIKIQFVKPEDRFIQMRNYPAVLQKENRQDLGRKQIESELNKDLQKEEQHVVFEEITRKVQPQLQTKNAEQQIEAINTKKDEFINQNVLETVQKVPDDNQAYIPFVTQLTEDEINFNQQVNTVEQKTKILPFKITQATQYHHKPNDDDNESEQQESPFLSLQADKTSMQNIQHTYYDFVGEFLSPAQTTKKSQKLTYPTLQTKQVHDNQQQQSQQQKQHFNLYQNYSQLTGENQHVIIQPIDKLKQQLRKQFGDKLLQLEKRQLMLEKNNDELRTKYNDLFEKYSALALILQQSVVKVESKQDNISEKKHLQKEQQIKPQIEGYEKLPNFDPFQHILNNQDYQDEPKVEIKDLDSKKQYSVGQIIKPQFFIVNTGSQKWPENVVVVSQSDVIQIKSLEPNEEDVLQLKEITVGKQDAQIREKYSLGFYNQKGELKYFGHRFGVRAKVVDGEILKEKHKNEFNYYIHQLMIQNEIYEKDLKTVVNYLRSNGLNEKNYTQADENHLIDVINCME